MIFLGTGASEMIPDPFCSCDVCSYARKHPEETIEALSGVPVDILIMDATFGSCRMDSACTHLDAYTFVSQLERLVKAGTVTSKTRIFASHINHYNRWTHDEYEKFLKDSCPGLNITVARDGMVI